MAEPDQEDKNRKTLASPHTARRCRIPKLNRSMSVRSKGESIDGFNGIEIRPKSLALPSSRSREFPWPMENQYRDRGSVTSMPYHVIDDDRSSVKSFGSFMSYTSFASQSQCTEASVTRPASRMQGKKYILHCDRHLVPQEEYLTPTQRKEKEIRQLKTALMRKTRQCEDKENEIERLKSDLERLQYAISEQVSNETNGLMHSSQESDQLESLNAKNSASEISFESHDTDKSDIQNTITVNNDDSGISNDMSMSPRNSSEFDETDVPTRKISTSEKGSSTDPTLLDSSLDSLTPLQNISETVLQSSEYPQQNFDSKISVAETRSKDVATQETLTESVSPRLSQEFESFLNTYQKELDQLKAQHKEHYQDLKEKFNGRVDDLLQKLGEANSRYLELRPLFDRAQDKIHSLENQLTEVQRDIETQEEWHNQMYLKMYRKGQEAARFEQTEETMEFTQRTPKRASVPDLLRQLHQLETELDQTKQLYREATRGMGDRQAEYTLRFLKDAVFYFLTKKDKEHLKAIQSILGFTDAERMAVAKAMKHRRL